MSRGICVPLCLSHPDSEIEYVLQDSGASRVLATKQHSERLRSIAAPLGAQVDVVSASREHEHKSKRSEKEHAESLTEPLLAAMRPSDGALVIYTSGTTGRPKGALHTLGSLDAQVTTLRGAWGWKPTDRILHTLPLHHVHGIVNALLCELASGAGVEFLPKFSPTRVWQRLQQDHPDPITVFMGVPTMYAFLLSELDKMAEGDRRRAAEAAAGLRLTVSGSSACPLPIMQRWEEVSGQVLLERYGMTETGMILGNPLRGQRRPGTVGKPFPGVDVRLDEHTGELGVRSAQLFAGYWGRPDATDAAFDPEGWFLTGDTAEVDAKGYYRLLGRTSVDIIKHGGYKLSALDIESKLLEHPDIRECAVVGLADDVYGEQVAAVVALKGSEGLRLEQLQQWAKHHLAPYQVPKFLKVVPELPRNAMGKVNKKALKAELFPGAQGGAGAAA